jgi:uncharacterized protein
VNFQSALYVGSVMHRRLRPRLHKFRYRAFWILVDLDEIDDLSGRLRLFSHNRFNLFSFRDKDHGDGTATPLRAQVERQLREAGINLAGGSIRLLCMPRTLGYCFNPLSVYFCYRVNGTLGALVYQVHNTFGDRHSYVIPVEQDSDASRQHCQKSFYVSPFMDMNMRYDFRITDPGQRIGVGIRTSSSATPIMSAILTGVRKHLTDRNLMILSLTIPAVTLKAMVAIHWEALRLWLKGLRFHRRPAPSERMTTIASANPTGLN